MSLEVCKNKNNKKENCNTFHHRYSFAIPLEIIYLTPLLTWNPFNLYIHQKEKAASDNGGNGNADKPLNGTDQSQYNLTPAHFFKGNGDINDPADTVGGAKWVLDQQGNKVQTVVSGTRIILPDIEGVGKVRLRYPIAPVHGEGSSVWKELNALKDYVKSIEERLKDGVQAKSQEDKDKLPEVIHFKTSMAKKPTEHYHTFSIGRQDYLEMQDPPGGLEVKVTTSEEAGHTHDLYISYSAKRGFEYRQCGQQKTCWDKHPKRVIQVNGVE